MSVVLKIDRRRKLVLSTFYGDVNGDELVRHGQEIQADPDFDPNFDEIVDFTSVAQPTVSEETLAQLATGKSIFSSRVRHVIVAPADLPFELAKQYQALTAATRPKLMVVRTLAEAYQLLDIGSRDDLRPAG